MKCATKFCRGNVGPRDRSPYCPKCRARRFKAAHPLKYAFNKLRNRARERGHAFTLTFADYEAFAVASGYDKLKGKFARALSIHRRDDGKGYEPGNLVAISLGLNARLRWANGIPQHLQDEWIAAEREALRDWQDSSKQFQAV